jgi:hypothetical protein
VLSMLFMVVLKDCFASVLCMYSMSFRVSCLDERFEVANDKMQEPGYQ